MTVWFVPVALVVLALVAFLAAKAAGSGTTPAQRGRRRHGGRPTPYRRCQRCRLPSRSLPVVCGFPNCPEVRPIKMSFAEYIEISDHLK